MPNRFRLACHKVGGPVIRRPEYRSAARRWPGVTPALIVTVALEAAPQVRVVASTDEDVVRLALWLERSDVLDELPGLIADAAEQLIDDGGEP